MCHQRAPVVAANRNMQPWPLVSCQPSGQQAAVRSRDSAMYSSTASRAPSSSPLTGRRVGHSVHVRTSVKLTRRTRLRALEPNDNSPSSRLEVQVPKDQRPVNELANLKETWLYSWVRLTRADRLARWPAAFAPPRRVTCVAWAGYVRHPPVHPPAGGNLWILLLGDFGAHLLPDIRPFRAGALPPAHGAHHALHCSVRGTTHPAPPSAAMRPLPPSATTRQPQRVAGCAQPATASSRSPTCMRATRMEVSS
jgi:hypothetical protein